MSTVWRTTALLALAMLLAACASASVAPRDPLAQVTSQADAGAASRTAVRMRGAQLSAAALRRTPTFEFAYAVPESAALQPIYTRVRDIDLLRQLPEVQAIDGMFALPRSLRFVTAECGESGAFYHGADGEVILCYETLRVLYARGQERQRVLGLGEESILRYVYANVRFIVLHETGHALVHLLDLPITGRQEDAVDQLAAILMLRFAGLDETPAEVIDNLRMAANWMLSHSTGAYSLDAYADAHALGEQRFFNLQCLIYGTDPEAFTGMVDAGDLTAARARGCAREMRLVSRAWLRLLVPHLAPGHDTYGEEAALYLQRSTGD